MSDVIEKALEKMDFIIKPNYTDYIETDKKTRTITQEIISSQKTIYTN